MMGKLGKSAYLELFWVAAGQGVTLLLGIVTLKILTSLLGPESYGQFALGLSIAGGLNLFFYGPLSQAVSRYFHICSESGHPAALDRVLAQALKRVSWGVVLGGALIAALLEILSLAQWIVLVLVALGYGIFSGVLSVYLAQINTRRQRRRYSMLQSADAALRLMAATALIMCWAHSAVLALAGFLLGSLLVCGLARKNSGEEGHSEALPPASSVQSLGQDFTRYAASFSLFAVPGIFAVYGDRWLIQQAMTDADVGIYVALAQIAAAPANLLLSIFSQTLNPILFQRAGAASSPASVRASRFLLYRALVFFVFSLFVVVVVSAIFGATLVQWMTSAAFAQHGSLLWNLVLSAAVFQIGQALAAEAFVYNRPFLMFFPKTAHALVFLGLAFLLVGERGLEGVALAAVFAAFVYLILVVVMNAWGGRHYARQNVASKTGSVEECV